MIALVVAAVVALSPGSSLDGLQRRIAEIAAGQDGVVGVAIVHVESGARAVVRGSERFSMHSVYKLPIALAVLAAVDAGKLRIDQSVTIAAEDTAGYSPTPRWQKLPQEKTLQELLDLAIADSDNVASDKLLELVGGPPAVTRWLAEHRLTGIDVGPSVREMRRHFCRRAGERPAAIPLAELAARCAAMSAEQKLAASRRDVSERRNVATPLALASLLAALQQGTLLREPTRRVLRTIMEGTRSGPARIRAGFPAGTVVAHKTGTGANGTNDVGIVTLPGGRGHLAIVALVKLSRQPTAVHERTIAAIAGAAAAAPWPAPTAAASPAR